MELQDSCRIEYSCSFPDGSRNEFDLDLAPRTIVLRTDADRPLPRFHLPSSTLEESLLRTVFFCPLDEHFRHRRSPDPDRVLKRLGERCRRVKEGFPRRMKKIKELDADKNALLPLHSLAQGEMNSAHSSTLYLFAGDDGPEDTCRELDA